MEIHPPESPIHSLKQFLVHLAMVTLGILIALGLEGVTQHFHHQSLAQQAVSNFDNEIAYNRRTLEEVLDNNEKLNKGLATMLAAEPEWRQGKLKHIPSLNINPKFTTLRTTSWDTAQATQALSYMKYQQVERYSAVYQTERQFNTLELNAEEVWFEIAGFRGDPKQFTPDEIRSAIHALNKAYSYSTSIDDLGKRLLKEYDNKVK